MNLASKKPIGNPIFPHRFVVEICEKVHVHYRNLRILLSLQDFISMAEGMRDALKRWESRGCPEPSSSTHIELCRKEVAKYAQESDLLKINLNRNLYNQHENQIFADGANFHEEEYIHLKIRDLRLELSKADFKELCEAVKEAEKCLA